LRSSNARDLTPISDECYDETMRREDIRTFATRDWAAIGDAKARFWAERNRSMTVAEALATAEMLRQHTSQVKPSWPDADERAADMALHIRISEALRAVPPHRSR
jgi:hypothetical protein